MLKEPPGPGVATRRRQRQRPYGVRKPRDYRAKAPGDIVQVDTLDVRPLPGVILKHFTARDVVSRYDVLEAHTRATARRAAQFLDSLQRRMPFPVRAIQVDGGSEFQADFEAACQERGIRLFVLSLSKDRPGPPSSTATWSGPSAPTPRSSTTSTTATWQSRPSTRRCWPGKASTTPPPPPLPGRTNPSRVSSPLPSRPAGPGSVSHVLNEYKASQLIRATW